MLGAVLAGGLKALSRRKRRLRNPRTGLVKKKKKNLRIYVEKKGQPLGDRSKRRRRLNPKEESIARIRRVQRRTSSDGKPDPRRPRITKPAPRPTRPIPIGFHRDPRRIPDRATRPYKKVKHTRVQEPSKTAGVKPTKGASERVTSTKRTPEPVKGAKNRTEPNKRKPERLRRRRRQGPSYTTTSLNV